mmetsp:Transcript_59194/g.137858  ORF Transcript_59194/g.137858 Transcript_59194/m.137858 type:complete len:202 (+) Transcript_59194:886-1491(+)
MPRSSPWKSRRRMAITNWLKEIRPLPSGSRPCRHATNNDPKRLLSISLRSSMLHTPARYLPCWLAALALKDRSSEISCWRHLCMAPLTGWNNTSSGMGASFSGKSVKNSGLVRVMMPFKSAVIHCLHALGSNCWSVMPRLSRPLCSILKSFLGSKDSLKRRQQSRRPCSSMRPLPFGSIPLRHAVSMSPYSSMSASLKLPT